MLPVKGTLPHILLCLVTLYTTATTDKSTRPNIVLMVADDLGYGDVGCFGNTTLRTPNIDRLAREGVKLTHHLAAASVCSPSRAALLTGRYPVRSGMVPDGVIRVNLFIANRGGLPPSEVTLATYLQSAGYKTALIGKWHLGMSRDTYDDFLFHPRRHGFDYYYGHILTNLKDFGGEGDSVLLSMFPNFYFLLGLGYILGALTFYFLLHKEYISKLTFIFIIVIVSLPVIYLVLIFENLTLLNSVLMRNFDVVEQPIQLESLMKRYVTEGIEFMEQRKHDESPFLLVLSWDRVHTAFKIPKEFRGKSKHGRYGDAVEELDWGTGEIMTAINKLGFGENTLVYFTSDNGGHLEEIGAHGEIDGGYNGIFKGGKTHGAVEGGIRVPTVVWFPGRLPSGVTIDEPTSQMDILPAIAHLTNIPISQDTTIDGKNIYPLLTGEETVTPHEFMFHYCGNVLFAVRYRPRAGQKVWKLVFYEPNYLPRQQRCVFVCSCTKAIKLDPPELYELTTDPGESKPLDISSPSHKEIVDLMLSATQDHVTSVKPVESQVTSYKVMWWPHLQPCCGHFPYCSCKDSKFSPLKN